MDKKLKPFADISVVTGQYEKDGKTRNRYHKIGVLFATPHLSNMSMKLDVSPLNSDGWLKVFVRDDWKGYRPDSNACDQPPGETLGDISF